MRPKSLAALVLFVAISSASTADAQLTSPKVGWTAELSTIAHGVSGSVTVVDEDTVRVDDFTYDGGGIVVYFYLGQQNTQSAFISGLSIGDDLFGTSFSGSQPAFTVDLPVGQTLEGWNAISVWCVDFNANFGSGTFLAPSVPGDFNGDGIVDAGDYTVWRDHLGEANEAAIQSNGDGQNGVDAQDYNVWVSSFGSGGNGTASVALGAAAAAPEPATWLLAALSFVIAPAGRRRSRPTAAP
jgi:hypothetical protein